MDSNTRTGADLPTGLEAFEAALRPQEGQFMRGATHILNPPKDLLWKPSRSPNSATSDADRTAKLLQDYLAAGGRPPPLPER